MKPSTNSPSKLLKSPQKLIKNFSTDYYNDKLDHKSNKTSITEMFKDLYSDKSSEILRGIKKNRDNLKSKMNDKVSLAGLTHRNLSVTGSTMLISTSIKNYTNTFKNSHKSKSSKFYSVDYSILPDIKRKIAISQFSGNPNGPKYYCPCCEHCNKIEEPALDAHIFAIKESKNILNKALEFIITTEVGKKGFDFRSENEKSENENESTFNVETLNSQFPKQSNTPNSRYTYQVVTNYLDALIENKVALEHVASQEVLDMFNNSLLAKGYAFQKESEEEALLIDPEIRELFDESMKSLVENLYRKNYLMKIKDITKDDDLRLKEDKKKILTLFLIFIQILSEISLEFREKAILLYKFFKMYFVEVEKKWLLVANKIKEKVKFYKQLCKTIIHQKNKHIERIEVINDVLVSHKMTPENLASHKKLIHDLLGVINEKREEIFILKSQVDIANKELRFWVYNYDVIKLNKSLRDEIVNFQADKVRKNIDEELRHKSIKDDVKSLIVNSDKFIIVSGQRNYFFELKKYYLSEIERLTKMYQMAYYKKKDYKKLYKETETEKNRVIERNERELTFLRNKLKSDHKDFGIQTDVDMHEFSKIQKNSDLVKIHKRLTNNKLNEYLDRINYNLTKYKPISKRNLLAVIPEILNEKYLADHRADMENKKRMFMDDFLFQYLKEKYKLNKLIKKNSEELILAIVQFGPEDGRIDLFRKFLGIGEDKLRREILDLYLIILKSLPISFYKMFDQDEDYSTYVMNTELCFEIYYQRFQMYNLIQDNKSALFKYTYVSNSLSGDETKLNEIKKFDFLVLNRFYKKSFVFVKNIMNEMKTNKLDFLDLEDCVEQFLLTNKEFYFTDKNVVDILNRNFKVDNGKIDLHSFFNFFNNLKLNFRIKIFDFLEVSLNSFIAIFSLLEKKIKKMFDEVDYAKNGYIFFKGFEDILLKLIPSSDYKWKINDYFRISCGTTEKDFVSKEEFVMFVTNTKELMQSILKDLLY